MMCKSNIHSLSHRGYRYDVASITIKQFAIDVLAYIYVHTISVCFMVSLYVHVIVKIIILLIGNTRQVATFLNISYCLDPLKCWFRKILSYPARRMKFIHSLETSNESVRLFWQHVDLSARSKTRSIVITIIIDNRFLSICFVEISTLVLSPRWHQG